MEKIILKKGKWMKRILLLIILVLISCFFGFATEYDTNFSTQDYLEYLNTLQNPMGNTSTDTALNFHNLFDYNKIIKQIQSLFSVQNINQGKWHHILEKSKHASLIVFFLAVGGIAVLVYGYKLFPFLLLVFGALLGGFSTYNVIVRFFEVSENELLLFVILGAIIAALAALLFKNAFVFLLGASFGLFVSQMILNLYLTQIVNTLLFMVFTAGLFALVVFLFKKWFIFFFTSLLGSVAIVFAAQYLILLVFQNTSFKNQLFTFSSIVLFLILLITGFLIQFKTNKN